MDAASIWDAVHAEREALIRDLSHVSESAWSTPSLCPGWDAHDVLAHLVGVAKTHRRRFVAGMVGSRGDFDRANQRELDRERCATPEETLAVFASVARLRRTPPAPLATRLVEEFLHGEDIRRPLGIVRDYPSEPLDHALRYQLGTSVRWGGARERVRGRRLVATDADVTHGEGVETSGRLIDLLVLSSGRLDLGGPSAR